MFSSRRTQANLKIRFRLRAVSAQVLCRADSPLDENKKVAEENEKLNRSLELEHDDEKNKKIAFYPLNAYPSFRLGYDCALKPFSLNKMVQVADIPDPEDDCEEILDKMRAFYQSKEITLQYIIQHRYSADEVQQSKNQRVCHAISP